MITARGSHKGAADVTWIIFISHSGDCSAPSEKFGPELVNLVAVCAF
jgi:hypothetical protein